MLVKYVLHRVNHRVCTAQGVPTEWAHKDDIRLLRVRLWFFSYVRYCVAGVRLRLQQANSNHNPVKG